MTSIVVVRYAGDKQGEDIVDPFLSSVEAQLSRGRAELDAHARTQQSVRLQIVYRAGLRLGQLVEVHDAMQGASYRGKLTGISHSISGESVITNIDLVRPSEV